MTITKNGSSAGVITSIEGTQNGTYVQLYRASDYKSLEEAKELGAIYDITLSDTSVSVQDIESIVHLAAYALGYEACLQCVVTPQSAFTFDPQQTFESVQEALDLICAQSTPLEALMKVVKHNIEVGEFGFSGELILAFSIS